MNAREQLLLDFEHLPDGTTAAGQSCPACGGGRDGENTLSVSREGANLLWNCHRASCNFRGASTSRQQQSEEGFTKAPDTRGVVGRSIVRESCMVADETRSYLLSRYGVTSTHLSRYGIGWDTESNRLCVPVRGYDGTERGVVLRALDKRQPKSQSHTEQGAISWFTNHTAPGVIIVEDQFSAIRASDYLTSVALLGTHLNDERVAEIRASKLSPVYIALDADAYSTVLRHAIKYRNELRPQVRRLHKDIKDMSDTELKEFMNGITAVSS